MAKRSSRSATSIITSVPAAAFNAVFADGQVQSIEYGIEVIMFNSLGDRSDGMVVDLP
ncbi:hypothetical protein MalM25_23760 [Planctomycetes bacterium MalM25]|nr:hypothetical protein MalM25_23760 [Planctomycetes bacterium MalM25]